MSLTLVEPPNQPKITYHPTFSEYTQRTSLRLSADPSLTSAPLPPGWPKKISGPIVWEGKDFAKDGEGGFGESEGESEWVYRLSESEIEEIEEGARHFESLNIPLGHISPITFPLPTLHPTLRSLSQILYTGRGFFVLRTIPIEKYTKERLAIIYAGVMSHVAPQRGRQSSDGAVFAHIKDLRATHGGGADQNKPMTNGTTPTTNGSAINGSETKKKGLSNSAYTTDAQVFHTDAGDLISLLALQTAKSGGVSKLASSGRIYNELAETRPDLVKVLSEEWVLDTFGGNPPYTLRPLLFYTPQNRLILQYSRRHFTGYGPTTRSPSIPPISEAQAEALDAIHFLAEKFSLRLDFRKGDIQVINSLGLVHAREEFTDSVEEGKVRHLIRLWLRDEELAWSTPPQLAHIWEKLYSIKPEEQRFPVEPEIRMKAPGIAK